jgi:hypothetical protein
MALSLYDAMLSTEPLSLFKKYSVAPPSGMYKITPNPDQMVLEGQVIANKPTKVISSNMAKATIYDAKDGVFDSYGSSTVEAEKRVCSGHLVNGQAQYRGGLALDVAQGGLADWVPIYFLPWDSKKIYSMNLPRKGSDADPHIFFTAAINGCSVFVRGDPKSPTVYHAGINTDMHGNLAYAAPKFWKDFLKFVAAKEGIDVDTGKVGEVNTTDYMNQFLATKTADKTTLRVELYKDWLESSHKDKLRVETVSPWGCVFGIRTGDAWKFYLQENAAVSYVELKKVKKKVVTGTKFLGLKKIKKEVEEVIECEVTIRSRPLVIREFFPGGSGEATPKEVQRILPV